MNRLRETTFVNPEKIKMSKLLQPYKVGYDIGLFLVNSERTWEKVNIPENLWSQRLLTVLPCKADSVLARLSKEDADDYAKAKATLLGKYRLSTEGFRQKFRSWVIKAGESYPEFAYNVKATMVVWLKSASAYDDRGKVLKCLCLEQFYRGIPDKVMFWVQDRTDVETVEQTAQLARDYVMRSEARGQDRQGKAYREIDKSFGKKLHFGYSESGKGLGNFSKVKDSAETVPKEVERHNLSKEAKEAKAKRAFETKRQSVCYNCNEPGHFAANCPRSKVVFSYVSEDDENVALVSPYMRELDVKGKPCRVLRDSAFTIELVHPSCEEWRLHGRMSMD